MASSPITSTMQDDFQLTITTILRHGATVHGRSECVTWLGDRGTHASYAEIARNAERLAAALAALGIGTGDRIGTFCWNNQAHLEAYYAVPCMGAVLHTINIRLSTGQVAYIVNHAEDRAVIVDGTLLPLFAQVLPQLTTVETVIVSGPADTTILGDTRVLRYEQLLAGQEPGFRWPDVDEKQADSLLKTTFKALRRVTVCPWRIGAITKAALVLLRLEHGRPLPAHHSVTRAYREWLI